MFDPKRIAILAIVNIFATGSAAACPFCNVPTMTFSEEIESMDVAVIGQLLEVPEVDDEQVIPKATFRITKVVRGDTWVKEGDEVKASFYAQSDKQKPYLLMATDAPNLAWISPLKLSARSEEYVHAIQKLKKNASRLEFFQDFLEDEDELLARDAYDEFAKAPYADVIALGPKLHRDRLLKWIDDNEVSASRKRLYFTLLGVCGTDKELPFLESLMKSKDRKRKAGLDALIACYLTLRGADGLPLIEDLFLKNDQTEYSETYSAIMAIRFHGTETDKIDRKRLVKSLRYILDRPKIADLVVPDLAAWEDWEVMDRLVRLFKEADETSSWIRVPVINYLRQCPLPEAKQHLEELKAIDPEAVNRAYLIPLPSDGKSNDKKEDAAPVNATSSNAVPYPRRVPEATVSGDSLELPVIWSGEETANASVMDIWSVPNRRIASSGPNLISVVGVQVMVGIGLFYSFRQILGFSKITRSVRR